VTDPAPLSIVWKKKGTLVIEGPVIIRDEEGNEIPQPVAKHPGVVKLCGCGLSKDKPFCDGSHKQPTPSSSPQSP
jgi:CDGSH-type Zn-finger protein